MTPAYFITFTTYGTWLHGTNKGKGSVDRQQNIYGNPFIEPNEKREQFAVRQMVEPPYVLNEAAREIVRNAIVDLCREKEWKLMALHVRSNHIHAVISAEREPGR